MDLKDVLQKNVECKHLTHDGDQWWSLVDTVLNLGSMKDGDFFFFS